MKPETKRLVDELVDAIKERFVREVAPLQEYVRGLSQRLDRQNQRIEQLERTLAESEAKASADPTARHLRVAP